MKNPVAVDAAVRWMANSPSQLTKVHAESPKSDSLSGAAHQKRQHKRKDMQ